LPTPASPKTINFSADPLGIAGAAGLGAAGGLDGDDADPACHSSIALRSACERVSFLFGSVWPRQLLHSDAASQGGGWWQGCDAAYHSTNGSCGIG
jgi:hypothetical protein